MSGVADQHEVTRLIQAAGASDRDAADQLFALIYDQLRRIAQQKMGEERAGHTLQATALVHEAYVRLVGNNEVQWQGRGHFFAAAAEAMRRILIERARQKAGPKRGGHWRRIDLDEVAGRAEASDERLLALDEALTELERHDPQAAALVKLRYFAGLRHEDAAEALGIGRRAADRLWALARAWLYEQIRES